MAMEQVPAPCAAPGSPNSLVTLRGWIIGLRPLPGSGPAFCIPQFHWPYSVIWDKPSISSWIAHQFHWTYRVIRDKPSSNGGLHQDEWPSKDLKFTVAPSWNGGFDINIGSKIIHVPKYLSAQNPLVQMVLFAACHVGRSVFGESVQDGSMFRCPKEFVPKWVLDMVKGSRSSAKGRQESGVSDNRELGKAGEDGVTLDKGARGSVSCEGSTSTDDRKISKLSKKDNGAPGSEPDKTDWQQQQDTLTGVNHVGGLHLLGVDAGLSDASGTAGNEQGCIHACQGKMECCPINLGENSADSGSVICETGCKIISGLAAAEHLNEQHLMKDDAEHRQQHGNGVWKNSSTEQKKAGHYGEQDDHSGCRGGALKNTSGPAAATASWLMASAVPHHATGNRDLLSGLAPVQGDDLFVKTGDAGAAPMRVAGTGSVVTDAVVLPDVWYVPGLVANVVSVSQLAELDYSVAFIGGQCYVRSAAGVVVGAGRAGEDGLFALDFIRVPLAGLRM